MMQSFNDCWQEKVSSKGYFNGCLVKRQTDLEFLERLAILTSGNISGVNNAL